MTAIKHTLQREVFLPSEERLIAVVHVTKAGKKKKASFLCAAVTTEKPIQALVYQVKKADRGDGFKKKISWPLRQLRMFDAKYANDKESAEFDMQFDKTYKWVASNLLEKNAFIQCLWKLSQRYLVQKPEFLNLPPKLLEDTTQSTDADRSVKEVEDIAMAADSDWQALTPKEETDLDNMMSQTENAISNAEDFAEQLSRDLSVLDGANIHSIMGSEDQVMELMVLLDKGLQEAMQIEEQLDEYESKLQSVKELMEIMKDKDTLIQVRNRNHHKLLSDLDKLISHLDLDHRHMKALLDADLCSPQGIADCTVAAKALQKCMCAEIHPSLEKMAAVQEQQKRFVKLKSTFAKRLAHHLNNLFIHQGNELGPGISRSTQELHLPQHVSSHRDLTPYADLMHWLKVTDADSFKKLRKVYNSSLYKLYDREVKEFIETAKQKLGVQRVERRGMTLGGFAGARAMAGAGSSSSLNRHDSRKGSMPTLDLDSQRGSDPDIAGRLKFDQMFEQVLSELGPWCLAEQDFCVKFFHLADDDSKEEKKEDGPWTPQKQRKLNEEVRKMMGELFPSVEQEITNFTLYGIALDNFNSLYMLVRMSQHVSNAEDTGSFLAKMFGNSLVQIKRNFDRFVQDQIRSIQESRLPKKGKAGILPFVNNFEEFAQQAEAIFRNSNRRNDLDKAYEKVLDVAFVEIARVAKESQKTSPEVIMFAMLSQLKITCLDAKKREAKQKYLDHLHTYVTQCLGRPMEKVSQFFEGIESRISSGVKADEVGYQLAYSKQELRKVIKEYTGKEVKKGLEHLYKRVEKQLCDEENLNQVVWHTMQDEFIKQYKYFESMITKCYPQSGIVLEFTINDLLGYFSDIAYSH